ncbi:MAG: N-acetyltransferase [Chloroflexi bacterium]|nr:N-acetyltransferase [Chloroflexota bacterium]
MSGQLTVREATEADVPAILDIYNHFILNSTATFDVDPQTLEERLHWLRDASDPYCAFVADSGGDLAGFGSLGPFRSKAAYRYTTENSVYVRPERHGEGIGKLLLTRTVEIAKENGFRAIIARIAGDNPVSVRLHERCGFQLVGTEREVGYKFEQWIDVVVMQLTLAD